MFFVTVSLVIFFNFCPEKYIVFMDLFSISCHSFFNILLNSPKYLQDSRQIQYIFNVSLSRKN